MFFVKFSPKTLPWTQISSEGAYNPYNSPAHSLSASIVLTNEMMPASLWM